MVSVTGISVWITSILSVVVIGVVADLLLHGNRMHKFIRGVFGFVTLFIIVAPLPSLVQNGFKIDNMFDVGGSFELDQNYLDIINARKIRLLEKGVEDYLTTRGVSGTKVEISAEVEGVTITPKMVKVDMSNTNLGGNDSDNKNEFVANLVSQSLGIERSQVTVFG